jgi:capsid protein
MFGINTLKNRVNQLSDINAKLQEKTSKLVEGNHKMNAILTGYLGLNYESFTGETNANDLPAAKELIICYEILRLRSWQFILKNHIANLIITKRVNWQIGTGLLFNAKPSDKPFIDYFGDVKGKVKHREFIRAIEYQFRNYINSKSIDYTKENNLHEIARVVDYNACGDGDVLLLMRVVNGFPNIQIISGQSLINPIGSNITDDNIVLEGVETNGNKEVVAYHVITDTGEVSTARIPVYFKGTNIRQAWLYKASDLKKIGETRSMPLLSNIFESLQHVNDYLIANAKHAQLSAQVVLAFEKDQNSTGERVFNDNTINVAGMNNVITDDSVNDEATRQSAVNLEAKMSGNGIVADLPKGVKAKILNQNAQSDQKEYLDSTLRTIFADAGTPYEVMISSYDSNYSASMGARSDYQYNLDVLTEIIPSNQLYKMVYELFVYLQVLKGEIICEPLKKAYDNNDIITIQALINSTFEGTKLKPIDPVKFINSLRAQLPEKIREQVPLNTIENLINAASNGDYEGVLNQIIGEMALLPKELEMIVPEKPANGTV